jgi:tetratricopeptide (TPR) repeat protein
LFSADVQAQPRSAKLWANLGYARIRAGRPAEAMAPFRNAVAIFPTYAQAYLGMAEVYTRLGDKVRKREMIEEARRRSPRSVDARLATGMLLLNEGNARDAVPELEEAVRQDPAHDLARFYLGYAYFRLGEYRRALAAFGTRLDVPADKREKWYSMAGTAHQHLGEYEAAAARFRAGLAVFSDSADLLERLGFVEYTHLKDAASARRHFARLLELQPDHPRGDGIRRVLAHIEGKGRPVGTDRGKNELAFPGRNVQE